MLFIADLKRWVQLQNPKFSFMQKSFGNNLFKLLDVGSGNHSASKTVSLFQQCEYYGLDLSKDYNNDEEDFKVMKGFYEFDLTKLDFSSIPDGFFDGIWIVHVIEHLHNGDLVLKGLLPKLKAGGYLYVEYPGKRSTKLPSMKGSLNFSDDHSHVRLYNKRELKVLFSNNGCEVLQMGYRRSLFYTFATPARILFRWIRGKPVTGNIFWDLVGFAEFLYGRKR